MPRADLDERLPRTRMWVGIMIGLAVLSVVALVFAFVLVFSRPAAQMSVEGGVQAPDAAPDQPQPQPGVAGDTGISALANPAWIASTAEATGIPARVLAAYTGAAMRVSQQQPQCGIDWTTLAGIGLVESDHGRIDGGNVRADGWQLPPIVGIALSGGAVDALPDTDGGAFDGDAQWDRAVGPMQIVPQTWEQYGLDGNNDGLTDPQQIDDAALTAANYLCAVGVDLRDSDGWIAAISAYNSSVDYNNRVAEATDTYRSN